MVYDGFILGHSVLYSVYDSFIAYELKFVSQMLLLIAKVEKEVLVVFSLYRETDQAIFSFVSFRGKLLAKAHLV